MTSSADTHAAHAHHHDEHDCAHSSCTDEPHRSPPVNPDALISARDLSLAFQSRPILQHVDLDISAGEIVTLIGPNGAGKTTLVRVLLGLEKANAGLVHRADGLVIGYVPQRFDIDPAFPMTVKRFLSLGATATMDELATVLQQVGASHVADSQLSSLSGGELQRVLLARAVSRKPNLLVLDEPVRGVDYAGEAELYTLLGNLRDTYRFGVLMVSHDLHVVMASSDRVVCLNRHVCCSGVPTTVAQHPEYTRLFGDTAARAFAVYEHHHDHSHDLAGEPHEDLNADSSEHPAHDTTDSGEGRS